MSSAISIRPNDSDDVKWALHTASTQVDRGSLADAIQWVKRAAQYAEDSGDAWRATELKNSARLLAERMWTSEAEAGGESMPPSIEVSVEDVDADDLLDGSSLPPPAQGSVQPTDFQRGSFQSVPPGVVLRQSYPTDSAPPEPIPLYPGGPLEARPYPLNAPAWNPPIAPGLDPSRQQPPSMQQQPSFGTPPVPFQGQSAAYGQAFPGQIPANDPGFGPTPVAVGPQPNPGAAFMSKAPTLQMGTPPASQGQTQAQRQPPPRRRSIRPVAPQRQSSNPPPPHRSSSTAGVAGGPEVFSSAPPADRFSSLPEQRSELGTPRAPMGSAPELLVSELDLEGAAFATGSLLPPAPGAEPDLTPEEFERDLMARDSDYVVSSAGFEVDPALADLFAPEEVVEDRDSVDRMSDIVLDPSEFEHQSLVDDQEETHVLTQNVVQSLKDAARQVPPLPPSESGEHEVMSQSGVPTAPPPGPTPVSNPKTSKPPPFSRTPPVSRPPSADMRRVTGPSSAPPTPSKGPFEPAPSSPEGSQSVPASGSDGSPSARSAPPVLVRRGTGPASSRAPESSAPASRAPSTGPAVGPNSSTPTLFPQASVRSEALAPSNSPLAAASPSAAPPSSIAPAKPRVTEPVVDNVSLEEARGFEDLPAEVQLALANSVRIEELNAGEEVSFFGAAIVTSGRVDILPAFSEEAGAVADEGDVIFTHGNLEASIDLRVVAKMDETRVAVWDPETLRQAIAECPWVADELKLIADRYLALCGATLGPLGERLDDSLRATVFQRLEVRVFAEGDVLAQAGKPVPGLLIIGGGRVLLQNASGEQTGELNMGDFVFASGLLGGGKAPETAVAARGGALVLTAPRQVAHELMMSVPPLVEVLAG